ncbi:MAG: FecR family protein [Verrucomicrobiota bacterium]|nr:FecR family protein [Verrucomicrobiota bacterium]
MAPARITRAVQAVQILPAGGAPQAARPNESIPAGAGVHTGAAGTAEVMFPDAVITRLAHNTVLRALPDSGSLELSEGAALFQAPATAGGASITTAGIHIAVAGTTGIVERYGALYVKVLVLEGTARVYLDRIGESILVRAGQMVITKPGAKSLAEPVHFEIAQLYKTSRLVNGDFPPLPSNGRIEAEIQKQQKDPDLIRTNLIILGRGTLVNLLPPTPTPSPPPKQ